MKRDLIDALDFAETEDPAEIAAAVAHWEAEHGQTTHVLFYFPVGSIPTMPTVGQVAVQGEQQVLPCAEEDPAQRLFTEFDRHHLLRAQALPFLAYAYLTLAAVTGKAGDGPSLIKVRKRAACRLLTLGTGDAPC